MNATERPERYCSKTLKAAALKKKKKDAQRIESWFSVTGAGEIFVLCCKMFVV